MVKDCIHAVLKEELANVEYSPEEMPQLTKRLSENIKDKLKGNISDVGNNSFSSNIQFYPFVLFLIFKQGTDANAIKDKLLFNV